MALVKFDGSVTGELERAEEMATQFLVRTKALRDRLMNDEDTRRYAWVGCKETAAVRRASLDLTRALAEMRKP
jgi:hypothetical protein